MPQTFIQKPLLPNSAYPGCLRWSIIDYVRTIIRGQLSKALYQCQLQCSVFLVWGTLSIWQGKSYFSWHLQSMNKWKCHVKFSPGLSFKSTSYIWITVFFIMFSYVYTNHPVLYSHCKYTIFCPIYKNENLSFHYLIKTVNWYFAGSCPKTTPTCTLYDITSYWYIFTGSNNIYYSDPSLVLIEQFPTLNLSAIQTWQCTTPFYIRSSISMCSECWTGKKHVW